MEFFIFMLLLMSVSFSVAILVYGFCLKFFGVSSTKSKLAQWVFTPLIVVGWDFLYITHTGVVRDLIGFFPIALLVGLLIYYKLRHGNEDAPEPHELINKKQSTKSIKHAEKIRRREEARQQHQKK